MKLFLNAKKVALFTSSMLAVSLGSPASAQVSDNVIRIGIIMDMSGVFSDISGKGHLETIKMAIADFGGQLDGKKMELMVSDHQTKADIAGVKAREWLDRKDVDVLMSGASSAADLAIAKIASDKKSPSLSLRLVRHG
jgi:branched-chain amino acid transport system substrate-binding protein